MATKTNKTTNDIKTEQSLIEIIQDINFRLTHLEDMEADNRKLMVKLVQQGNTMVQFLQQFNVEEIDPEDLMVEKLPELPFFDEDRVARTEGLKDLIDDIIEKHKDLKEFEEELEKYRNEITPGQVGES
tara:strand:+ start:39 stop:425 length:387 start_codon:yes stop_codon:yes gene_type:complete